MDVLAYSAFNRRAELEKQISEKQSCLNDISSCIIQKQAEALTAKNKSLWVTTLEPILLKSPELFEFYSKIEETQLQPTVANGFKVCNAATQFNCGQDCIWTVPAGVTCARFQLWGAGGGSGVGCCCGGSPHGSNGAYATVSMPVVSGCSYTICAGCAYCCFPSVGGCGRVPGCPSYVQGHGLNNFCADGGGGRIGVLLSMYGHRNNCRLSHIAWPSAGACLCDFGAMYCFGGSCATCGLIPFVPSSHYFGTAHCNSVVMGVRGMFPEICFDTNHYGYNRRPPMYGFVCDYVCTTWSSGNCCGFCCRAERGCHAVPGMGGWESHSMGGGNSGCGDMGRMGMVCVSYC